MLKFDEKEEIASGRGALALRPRVEERVDAERDAGHKHRWWLDVGGT